MRKSSNLQFKFRTTIIEWRGPSPFFYAPVPPEHAVELRHAAKAVSYGWGVVPVTAEIGGVRFTTSLFPKDGSYLLPLKAAVRHRANITVGDAVGVTMTLGVTRL